LCLVLFFFQAEDGIRDFHVTGVQTCALPICAGAQRLRSTTRQPRASARLVLLRLVVTNHASSAQSSIGASAKLSLTKRICARSRSIPFSLSHAFTRASFSGP